MSDLSGLDDADLVEFDLGDLDADFCDDVQLRLSEAGIAFCWDDDAVLLVPEVAADAVERLIETLEHPDALPVDPSGVPDPQEAAAADALSRWFVAADTLTRDPSRVSAITPLVETLDVIDPARAPFGVDHRTWASLIAGATDLRRVVAAERSADDVRDVASRLRRTLRPLV